MKTDCKKCKYYSDIHEVIAIDYGQQLVCKKHAPIYKTNCKKFKKMSRLRLFLRGLFVS